MAKRCLQGFCRRSVDDVEWGTRRVRHVGCALHRVGFDERRAGCVPGFQAAAAFRVARFQPIAQHPGDFDRFRMRTDHAAIVSRRLAQPEQKAVVDVGQPEAGAFAAAVIHEDLEARRSVIADIAGDACELRFGRNDKVIAEIDARALFGDPDDIVEDRLERLGRHQIRNKGGDAALCGRRRLAVGV
jgi:hypothetical protein